MRRTPALIVGGGLAGAATAIGLARAGRPHLLIERSRETGDAICGGFLSWRTLETLAGLEIDPDTLNPQRVTRARIFAGNRRAEAALPHPAVSVSRHRLDTVLLAEAKRLGTPIERGVTVREIDGTTVRLADGATIATDALFLASGKHDVRGMARPEEARGDDPTLGIRVRVTPSPALAQSLAGSIELHLFDRGYAGLAMQEDGTANLCMAVHRSRLQAAGSPTQLLEALGREMPALGEWVALIPPMPRSMRSPMSPMAGANVPASTRCSGSVIRPASSPRSPAKAWGSRSPAESRHPPPTQKAAPKQGSSGRPTSPAAWLALSVSPASSAISPRANARRGCYRCCAPH
ncbi:MULTISPECIES: NAD(P)/FAD-dependent oxidoreductase [unclassified Sphingomonas]|uniref:NAD(P)/FAD-dependent oxidoreductase n=1 Tax=unclassified Sphingomonas TaxID=196159 RepID=UPI002FE0DFDD